MVYSFERYYKDKLPLEKIVLVTAKTIGQWCHYYEVNVFWPKDGIKDDKQEGELPQDNHQKEAFIENLVKWIFASDRSHSGGFQLFLSSTKSNQKLFSYPDTPIDWSLNLDQKQFAVLQEVLQKNNFPRDLFYPADEVICVPSKSIWRLLGFQNCISPKEWAEHQKKASK